MTRGIPLPAICVAIVLLACSVVAAPQSDSPAPIPVKGTEHIAWDQTAPRGGWIVGFRFTVYVDDQPQALSDATCTPVFCTQCGCSAALPRMSSGTHRIEITARDVFGSESARSTPIHVALGSSAPPPTQTAIERSSTAPAGAPTPRIEVLSAALDGPSALAVAPDGRILVAERNGAILIWSNGGLQPRPATVIGDVAPGSGAGLVGLTIHPDFSANGRVFVAYTAREDDGAFANRIVRYRDVAGTLGEAAVIFEDRVREPPLRTPRIRVGPDRKLYALFPRGANAGEAIGSSYAGKILRFNEDGSTPTDNPGSTPVFIDARSPLAWFDWQPDPRTIWPSGWFAPVDRNRVIATARWLDNGPEQATDLVVGPDGALYFCGVNEKTRAGLLARVVGQ